MAVVPQHTVKCRQVVILSQLLYLATYQDVWVLLFFSCQHIGPPNAQTRAQHRRHYYVGVLL